MPRVFLRDAGGIPRQAKRIFIRDAGGISRAAKRIYQLDAGGIARLVFASLQLPGSLSISGTATNPAEATAGVLFTSDGNIWLQDIVTGSPQLTGVWDPLGDGSDYDLRATLLSGTAPNWSGFANTLGTWIQPTTNPYTASWGLSLLLGGGGTRTCVLQIDASPHGAGVAIATGQVTLEVIENPKP